MMDLQQSFDCEMRHIADEYNLDFSKIAVGVSGGADSLALVFLLYNYTKNYGGELCALTVNHHLRKEADAETKYVAELLEKNGIKHEVLHWYHEPVQSGMENKARQARYELLFGWCKENDCKILMTAHHLRDQAETFLMRLQRGSGVDGLASMAVVSPREEVLIVRPLLNFEPEELKKFLRNKNIDWCEDASNSCDDFLRVRVRKMLPKLEKELGLSAQKIASAAVALNEAKEYFAEQVDNFIKNRCRLWYGVAWSFAPLMFGTLHREIQIRVLAELIKHVADAGYAPEYSSLSRLAEQLVKKDFAGATLGRCEFVKFNNRIWVVPEIQDDKILSKNEWAEFVQKHSKINANGVPYKLKLYLVRKSG